VHEQIEKRRREGARVFFKMGNNHKKITFAAADEVERTFQWGEIPSLISDKRQAFTRAIFNIVVYSLDRLAFYAQQFI
jgi:hypothetical protein